MLLDGLFFKDARFDWYTGGFEGLAENFGASVTWLQDLMRRQGYEAVFLGGQSSGAYAALRVAGQIRPTAVIAFSPQTRNITNARGETLPFVQVEDLTVAYTDWDASYPIHIHLARSERENQHLYFWDDWAQIEPFLDKDNVTVTRHPFDTHVISVPLYSRDLFYKTILSNLMLHMPASPEELAATGEPEIDALQPDKPSLAEERLAALLGAQRTLAENERVERQEEQRQLVELRQQLKAVSGDRDFYCWRSELLQRQVKRLTTETPPARHSWWRLWR
jgi:hypothetical protein